MKYIITIFLLSQFSLQTNGKVLSLEDVLKQTRDQAPKVLMSLEKVVSAKEKVRAAEGGFDTRFKGEYYDRREGYYPGKYYQGKIEKPIPFAGSKVYGGIRKSEGDFPVYEGERVTLNEGEIMAGISFNLLRNFNIDEKRLKLTVNEFDLEKEQWKNKEVMMKLQKEASIAYWAWVSAGHLLVIAEDLLTLSETRQGAFEKRIKQGDLAALYSVENRQYIVKRKSKVRKALAEFQMASFYLSLYWRDAKGNPMIASKEKLPPLERMEESSLKNNKAEFKKLVRENFSLKSLGADISKIEEQQEFLESRFLPEVKVKYEVLRDRGDGSSTLRGTDHKIVVGLEIPIERNLIKGNSAANKAKQRILNHERRLLKDSLKVKLNQLQIKLDASIEIMGNTKQEVKLGRQLEVGEKKKFRSGASDFFVVNLREQNTFDARNRQIEALFTYQETLAKYREILMDYQL
ncbi:MAG: TolC family protein [Halobacteriovoraceae bacterium]|nr:TolC family protein [Halobacteriovoraceae bacterium]